MSERKASIDLKNLPARARQLKPGELHNVFGGCYGYHSVCLTTSECCTPLVCSDSGMLSPVYVIVNWCTPRF